MTKGERDFCRARQISAGIIALFQGNLTLLCEYFAVIGRFDGFKKCPKAPLETQILFCVI
jgi:hypothetical protein